ncbi:ATP-binding protein [Enterococcus cecorum]|nr:ATP-binding protein [Enterococcus cecorum]MDZ5505228.1 ATP-binding protein [Enterococcus cecorum]
MSSDIKIEIFDDRLAISSPGSLPDGLTVEDIKQGANAKRNPILINALIK